MAEIRTISSTGGEKGTKVQAYDKIPNLALTELAKLFKLGSLKYASRNWSRGYEWSKSYAAMQRHANLWWSGESIDLELHLNHMASVAWHAMVMLEFTITKPSFDDRPYSKENSKEDTAVKIDTEYPVNHVDDDEELRGGNIEPRFDLIPQRPLAQLAELYGTRRVIPIGTEGRLWSDMYARLQEHANLFWSGQTYDSDGFNHMAYVLHYSFQLFELYMRFPEFDDRFTEELGAAPIGFTSDPA